jgi:hypothetical protein
MLVAWGIFAQRIGLVEAVGAVRVFRQSKAGLPTILGLSRSANGCRNPTIGKSLGSNIGTVSLIQPESGSAPLSLAVFDRR